MTTQPPFGSRQSGHDWLLACTDRPTDAQRAWRNEDLAPFRTGPHWRVAEAPLLRSVKVMRLIKAGRLGPVLADVETRLVWWLLPAGPGRELDGLSEVTVRPPGWVLRCPPVLHSPGERVWLEHPDGSGRLTDPELLGAAFCASPAALPSRTTPEASG